MSNLPALPNQPLTLDGLVKRSSFTARFDELLGKKAPTFLSSLLAVGRKMPDVDPMSIVSAGMTAAVLDLPIDPSLGFAWIVPFREGDRKVAQFQIGAKGFVQLAQRSGYYTRMNARAINVEAFNGFDEVGEPIILWDKIDEGKEVAGYVFAFKLSNGFSKVCYWTKKRVQAHAQKYSQSYRGTRASPWKTNFDEMALKTVIKNELSDWGVLSIEFRRGLEADQSVKRDPDALVEYPDNALTFDVGSAVAGSGAETPEKEPEPPAGKETTRPEQPTTKPPEQEEVVADYRAQLRDFVITECGQTFTLFQKWGESSGMLPDAGSYASFDDVPSDMAKRILRAKTGLKQGLTNTALGRT
jgi:recombination protein RecT